MAERRLRGREFSIGLLDGQPMGLVEIVPLAGVYDFRTKYTKGASEYRFPAPLDAPTTAAIAAAYKLGEWNELVITANGNQLRHTVNGVVTADVTETDASIAKSGVIALQLHVGPPMTIQFKNAYLKTLP